MEKLLVKIQMPLGGNDPNPKALFYSENRYIMGELLITPDLEDKMDGRPKAFFFVTVDLEKLPGSNIEVLEEAPWQEW